MSSHTRRYVAVLEGEGTGPSRPILATSDPATVEAVVQVIRDRIATANEAPPSPAGAAPERGR